VNLRFRIYRPAPGVFAAAACRLFAITLTATLVLGPIDRRCGIAYAAEAAAEDPYAAAARSAGVPLELLVAIAGTESGYHPWALNLGGHQTYCRSREEAERFLATSDNADIGLMQINWAFWGGRLKLSKNALLDPPTNLMYGARILKQSLDRSGSLWQRIGYYHSGSTREHDRYNQQVYRAYLQYLHGDIR
jgi:soluble lytic murein transglycosylase-like protein